MVTPRAWVAALGAVLLVVVGCLIGVTLAEAGYRAYLYLSQPGRFRLPEPGAQFGAYNVSHWEFDEELGYVYPPARVIDYTGVRDGRVDACSRVTTINQYGNVGPVVGSYEHADLKILVFGDSWAAFYQQGKTWPLVLQELLGKKLGRGVHVINFGRDGYGVLQMFDLAAVKITEWKPDLVIIAFITDDITRARSWRTVVGQGDNTRVLTTLEPVRNPDPERAADTYLLMPSATYEWCTRTAASGGVDDVLERLIRKHRGLLAHNTVDGTLRTADVFTLRHSYLHNLLVKGDPFDFVWKRLPPSVNPRVRFQSYASDARFMRDLERITAAGVPWVLFHLAFYPEIKAQREYILNSGETALLESLEQVTGKKVWRTTDYVEMPVAEAARMNVALDNYHPSLWGMEFYAKAVAEALIRHEMVGARRASMPTR